MINEENDTFINMWTKQIKQDDYWIDREKFLYDNKYRMEVIKQRALDISDQLSKLLNLFPWKSKNADVKEVRQNILEQIIDIQKYVLGLASLMNFTPVEFYNEFVNKSKVIEFKVKQSKIFSKIADDDLILLIDIDGVVCNYSDAYIEFMNHELDVVFDGKDRKLYSFYETYGITRMEEEQLNKKFIETNGFSKCKPYPGAIKTLVDIRKKCPKLKFVMITARPSLKYSFIIFQTYEWLFNSGVCFDILLFEKDKTEAIINDFTLSNILYMIEDRDKHALEMSHIGVKVLLLNKPYNRTLSDDVNENIKRVYGWNTIKECVIEKYERFLTNRN